MGNISVNIQASVLNKNNLIMREHVCEATSETETIQLSITLNRAPMIEFADGKKAVFGWKELIEAAEQAIEKAGDKK